MPNNQKIVISLGGSILVPDEIDVKFAGAFRDLIKSEVALGKQFVIIVGGGKICRRYQASAKELGILSGEELDWVGIHVTKLNANFLRIILGDLAFGEIVDDPEAISPSDFPVIVGAGYKPGSSTDFDAVQIAKTVGAKKIINLSNIDYAYDKDPRKFPDAKKIEKSNWREFRKILPTEWGPGVNSPFDPVAARRAEELGIEVAIMNGANLDNLRSYLDGESFQGTVISG